MEEKKLSYISTGFMATSLLISIFLINQYEEINSFFIIIAFIILNAINDIILHRLGYTFKGYGIKSMILTKLVLLAIVIIFEIL